MASPYDLCGKLVCFAHQQEGGPVHRVMRVDNHGMVEL